MLGNTSAGVQASQSAVESCQLKKKKMQILKFKNYVFFGGLAEDLSTEDSLSESSEGQLRRGKGGTRIDRSFATKSR